MTEPIGTRPRPFSHPMAVSLALYGTARWPSATRQARLTLVGACIVVIASIGVGVAWGVLKREPKAITNSCPDGRNG